MDYQKAWQQVVAEGAIRIWRVSGGWSIAYRIKEGKNQARGMHKIGAKWQLGDKLVSSKTYRQADGWYQVEAMHQSTEPILSEQAEKNPGYFDGIDRRCTTCKKYRPIAMYNRDMPAERGMRSWECDKCADERAVELNAYRQESQEHIGDYVQRGAHASRPPVEGEL